EDQGHCFLTTQQLAEQLSATLQLDPESLLGLLGDNLQELNKSEDIISSPYSSDETTTLCHYSRDLLLAEVGVAQSLQRLHVGQFANRAASPALLSRIQDWLSRYCEKTKISLSAAQKQAVIKAATSKVFILTGGPGV